jgi:hypothetical protein
MPHRAVRGRNEFVPPKFRVRLAKYHLFKRSLPLRAHDAIPPGVDIYWEFSSRLIVANDPANQPAPLGHLPLLRAAKSLSARRTTLRT